MDLGMAREQSDSLFELSRGLRFLMFNALSQLLCFQHSQSFQHSQQIQRSLCFNVSNWFNGSNINNIRQLWLKKYLGIVLLSH